MKKNRKCIKKVYISFRLFLKKLGEDHVNAYAAQASFFIVIAIFPLMMLLLTLLKYTPMTETYLMNIITNFSPKTLEPLLCHIVEETYSNSGFAIISVTAIAALWSSGKGILAIIRGLNSIFKIDEKRNYIHLRIIACFYTMILLLLISCSLGFMVFGNSLLKFFNENLHFLYELAEFVISLRGLYIPVIFTLAFVLVYKIVPNRSYSFLDHIPGALFTSLGWIVFSYGYSFYIDNFASSSYIYGSLTTIVLLMLWIYFCMYILFIGAEINVQYKKHFRLAREIISDYKHDSSSK